MRTLKRLPQEERIQRIVQAATRAIARTGFRGTRSRDLAQEAGVSEGLVFKYFPDKRALQKAILEDRLRRTGPLLTPDMYRMLPRDVLRKVARQIIDRADQDPNFMRILLYSGLEGEPLAEMLFKRRYSQGIGRLSLLIRAWIRRGQVHPRIDPKLAAWAFVACVYQLMISKHIFKVGRMMNLRGDMAARIADFYVDGFKP
jgi:TetR/AcrR family transcriptional regulator